MTFEELFDKACTTAGLPEMAKMQLPSVLSDKTKKMILKLSPEEVGKMLSSAIDAVNKGSVETIDKLVREQLNK